MTPDFLWIQPLFFFLFSCGQDCDRAFQIIEMQVMSNWGHPEYTCMYRIRVHGTPAAATDTVWDYFRHRRTETLCCFFRRHLLLPVPHKPSGQWVEVFLLAEVWEWNWISLFQDFVPPGDASISSVVTFLWKRDTLTASMWSIIFLSIVNIVISVLYLLC